MDFIKATNSAIIDQRFNYFVEGNTMAKDNKDVTEAPVNFGANLGLMLDLYDDYLQDPSSVPDDLQVLFSTIKMAKLMSQLSQPLKGVVHQQRWYN